MTRGITCTIHSDNFRPFLRALAQEDYTFYVKSCSTIDASGMLLPRAIAPGCMTAQELIGLSNTSIWTLVLQLFPPNHSVATSIDTYEEYLCSDCQGCIIFYDCCLLDAYIKNADVRQRWQKALERCGAEEIILSTDENDFRVVLDC